MSSSIFESHDGSGRPNLSYRRKIESFFSSGKANTSKGLPIPDVIFNVRETPKTHPPQKKKRIQNSVGNVLAVIGDVEDALHSDFESDVEIELSDEFCKPKASTPLRRELLLDNMEMLSIALSRLETDDYSESSDEEDSEFGGDEDFFGF
jgi:hypothetical protein